MGTYDDPDALSMPLATLKALMAEAGVVTLYCKQLAPNDNSKNQPYLGADWSAINIIPTGGISPDVSKSAKSKAAGSAKFKAGLTLRWLTPPGALIPAPEAKIILYPQYPEARLSGFLKNSSIDLGEWMDPNKKGRSHGRCLFLGVTKTELVVAFFSIPNSTISNEIAAKAHSFRREGVFLEIQLDDQRDFRQELIRALGHISNMGWVEGRRLSQLGITPCNSPNCGGCTLEALLGIYPNSLAEPDFLGWEVKQFGVSKFENTNAAVITLMTPEPNDGFYKTASVEAFIRRYGYPDMGGRPDRLNFGGIHRFGKTGTHTGLNLELHGYDPIARSITDPYGGIALVDSAGEVAALWTFTKLIDHWKRKHNRAVYVPSMMQTIGGVRHYRFGSRVRLCIGTDFVRVLNSIVCGFLYYDPGLKLEHASTKPAVKRRNQFRMKSGHIAQLYGDVETVVVSD